MMQELLTKDTELKESPIGTIPKEWDVQKLPDVCTNHDSKRVPIKESDRASMRGKYRYYGASGVIDYVNDYIFEGEYILLGEDGENVLSRNLPLVFIVRGKYWVNNHAHVLKPKTGMDIGFLCEYLESLDYKNIASGSAQPKITQDSLNRIKVPVPPELEQQKIASILTSVDEVIERTKAQISKLQDLITGMMQVLLTKGIGHTEFKDSPVGRIPAGWELMTAQEMLDAGVLLRLQDGNHGSQYPRTSEFLKAGIPYIAASHISEDGGIDFEKCPKLAEERAGMLRIPPAKGGDVILTHNATVGRVAIIPQNKTDVVASTSTTYYRPNEERLLNGFLAHYFRSPQYQSQLQSIMGQTTRNQVPITAQKGLFLVFPSLAEQRKIAVALDSVANTVSRSKAKYRSLLAVKRALMHDLLTGTVRVKVN